MNRDNVVRMPDGRASVVDLGEYAHAALVSREIIQDAEISTDARFLYALCCTFPHKWTYFHKDLRNRTGWGRDRLTNALRVLKQIGVMGETKERQPDGTLKGSGMTFCATPSKRYLDTRREKAFNAR